MYILVINAGSSSVKYKLFDMNNKSSLAAGLVDRIGMANASLKHNTSNGKEYIIESNIADYYIADRKSGG